MKKEKLLIEDISAGGIRFASLKPHYISRNDTVELKFTLDNPMRTEIHTPIKIKWIIDHNVRWNSSSIQNHLKQDLGSISANITCSKRNLT